MKAFVTALSNDAYLKGCLVLNESLKDVHSKYPLVVLAGEKLSQKSMEILKKNNIEIVFPKNKLTLPEELIEKNAKENFDYWTETFLKLSAFDLTQYEKILLLDNDIYVRENIDDVLDLPHMTSVTCLKYTDNFENFCTGFIVIEPKENFSNNFLPLINELIKKGEHFGDQTVVAMYYPDWEKQKDLHLDVDYHMIFGTVDFHNKKYGYGKDKPIKSVHFPGKKKPWTKPIGHLEHYVKYAFRRQWMLFKIFLEYDRLLIKANLSLLKR